MVDNISKIRLISLNVRGINDAHKRDKLFSWFRKQNADIILMQEVHCTKKSVGKLRYSWGGKSFFSLSNSAHSRGVGILLKKDLPAIIIDYHSDDNGRQIILNIKLKNKMLSVVNVYAPNLEKDRITFFSNLSRWIESKSKSINDIICGGDFNCCLNANDRKPCTHLRDKSRTSLNTFINDLDLVDAFSHQKPDSTDMYTWNNGTIFSRLDYFFVNQNCLSENMNISTNIVISEKIGQRITDHKALILNLAIVTPVRGPGYWKMNTSILNDIEYREYITETLRLHKLQDRNINISESDKWELLKHKIKETSIAYCIQKAKQTKDKIISLEKELNSIPSNTNNDQLINRKIEIEHELNVYYTKEAIGAKIRSKVQYLEDEAINRKLFQNIEINNQRKNAIDLLVCNKKETSCQEEILDAIKRFYKNLYNTKYPNINDINDFMDNVVVSNTLSSSQNEILGKMPSANELESAVKNMNRNKSPGLDGIPVEFYQTFWEEIKDEFIRMMHYCWEIGSLPLSSRTAVISLIHKSGHKGNLKNYRPISLINVDYKLLTYVFASRLHNVLGDIIHTDQTGYIQGRYIGCSVRNIIDIYEYCENESIPGALISIDFEKAFDSLEKDFLFAALQKFQFGQEFQKWVNIFYTDTKLKVKNNGWVSESFDMNRGVKQGCPLSALLFIVAVEFLALSIRNCESINGIMFGDYEHKITQYADDATITVADLDSIKHVFGKIDKYSKISGLVLNTEKTKGIWMGPLKDLGIRKFEEIIWTGNAIKCLGVYIGHNKNQCYKLNWTNKVDTIEKMIRHLKCYKFSLFGKVKVIKQFLLSKFAFHASILCVPDSVKTDINKMFYNFLWGKRDKVKRTTTMRKRIQGGLAMIDLSSYLDALKAAWVPRLLKIQGKWNASFMSICKKLNVTVNYLINMSFKTTTGIAVFKHISKFTAEVLTAFNKCKEIKHFGKLTKNEILQQPLWGNLYFQSENCLFFHQWAKKGLLYVKDLFDDNGMLLQDNKLIDKIGVYPHLFIHIILCKRHIVKQLGYEQYSNAKYINIQPNFKILHANKLHRIVDKKSAFFYNILKSKIEKRGNMETIYSRNFLFENTKVVWQSIYNQKIVLMLAPKMSEFNFKVLHNIIPNGHILSKWNRNINSHCNVCNTVETTVHMLFECRNINRLWFIVSKCLGVDIKWKQIVVGFPLCDDSEKICTYNNIITIVAYCIFKDNMYCKYNNVSSTIENIFMKVRKDLYFYRNVLSKGKLFNTIYYPRLMKELCV